VVWVNPGGFWGNNCQSVMICSQGAGIWGYSGWLVLDSFRNSSPTGLIAVELYASS